MPYLIGRPHRRTALSKPPNYDRGVDRQRRYFVLMGTCMSLIILAWFVVRFFSVGAAIGMSVVAMFIPPIAVIVGNRSDWPRRPRAPRRRW
jgi:hypothetical protein